MKIILVANFTHDTNYTRDLGSNFYSIMKKNDEILLCGRSNEPVNDGRLPKVDEVWPRNSTSLFHIVLYALKKKPDVVHFQQEFKMYGGLFSAMLLPWTILFLRLCNINVVVTFHAIVSKKQLSKNFLESFGLSDTFFNKILIQFFLNYTYFLITSFSNFVTVHTNVLRQLVISEYNCSNEKVVVIEHGLREIINSEKVPANPKILEKYPVLKNKIIILVFGFFSPRKGFELLINSFSKILKEEKFKDLVMVLAGDVAPEFAKYKEKIEDLIKRTHLTNKVLITGYVDKQDIDEFYRLSKIAVIPAIFSFNTSGALSIALAYQKPLLVANVKPLSDEVKENNFGLLFNIEDEISFGEQIKKMITDKSLYKKLKEEVTHSAKKRYWDVIAKKHYDLYERAINNV